MFCGVVWLCYFGKEFITLWVGPVYEPAYAMAIVVMVPFTIDIVQNLGLTILQVMNRYGFRAKMYFIAACLNIISTLFLAHFWQALEQHYLREYRCFLQVELF